MGRAFSALKAHLCGLLVERVYTHLWTMVRPRIDFAALARATKEGRMDAQLVREQQSLEAGALEELRRPGARFEIVGASRVWVSDGEFATAAGAAGAAGVLPINGRLAAALREGRAVPL